MSKRGKIGLGMALGALWAAAVVLVPWQQGWTVWFPAPFVMTYAAFFPGIVVLAMVGSVAARRFFNERSIDGGEFVPESGGDIDKRVLTNTVEQVVLGLLIWPMVLLELGNGVVLVMAVGFLLARIAFWIGYHISPPLRAFGFAATFYPTVLAGLWSLVRVLT